jgi:hypothetical protein
MNDITVLTESGVITISLNLNESRIKEAYPNLKHNWIQSEFVVEYGTVLDLPGKWIIRCDKTTGLFDSIYATWCGIEFDNKSKILRRLLGAPNRDKMPSAFNYEGWTINACEITHAETEYYESVGIQFKSHKN